MIDPYTFAPKLINWYLKHWRDLPWRHTRDPYYIWLSEVILQQTRVKQGLPYYYAFVNKYPTVTDLAAAPEEEVLRLWQGLGYYSRARNLLQTARVVANQYGGVFPNHYTSLLALKGIGPYTAAAIASFAYKEPVAVLDGNVYRVLSRLFGIETDISSPGAQREFSALANSLISNDDPDLFNQAIMEFGAIQCTPVSPDCLLCPFQADCNAFATGRQQVLPVKRKKGAVKTRFFHYMVLETDNMVALRLRLDRDIWQGLYDFMLVESDRLLTTDELFDLPALQNLAKPAHVVEPNKSWTHLLTHQRIEAKFWRLRYEAVPPLPAPLVFFDQAAAHRLPKPVLIDQYLKQHFG